MPIDEASAKVRTGPPGDDDEDYALDTWAGVVPLALVAGAPSRTRCCATASRMPEHVRRSSDR